MERDMALVHFTMQMGINSKVNFQTIKKMDGASQLMNMGFASWINTMMIGQLHWFLNQTKKLTQDKAQIHSLNNQN